jgi:FixJ family two-component response regulator
MEHPPAEHATVVVIEDDVGVRTALAFALELEGFRVETYDCGEAFLLCDPPPSPACLVLDERLPGVSGLQTLRQLRERRVELPAILVTSHPGPRTRAAAASAGAPILEKPLMGETLVAKIQQLIAGEADRGATALLHH